MPNSRFNLYRTTQSLRQLNTDGQLGDLRLKVRLGRVDEGSRKQVLTEDSIMAMLLGIRPDTDEFKKYISDPETTRDRMLADDPLLTGFHDLGRVLSRANHNGFGDYDGKLVNRGEMGKVVSEIAEKVSPEYGVAVKEGMSSGQFDEEGRRIPPLGEGGGSLV